MTTLPATAPPAQIDPLRVREVDLRQERRFPIRIFPTLAALHEGFATSFCALLDESNRAGRPTRVSLPVGPFDYRLLAQALNARALDCRRLTIFGMDEFCQPDGRPVPTTHPWSLRAFLEEALCRRIDARLGLRPVGEGRVYPDAPDLERYHRALDAAPLDAAFFGFGVNGHVGMNEPAEPGEPGEPGGDGDVAAYAALPARRVRLSRETITQLAMGGAAGDLAGVPPTGVTIGMREVLGARRLRIYLMRTWQPAVVRRALYGPVTPAFPASLVQTHPDVAVNLVSYVAAAPWFETTQKP
jgi:glucosamine-6-phosphate deaminase